MVRLLKDDSTIKRISIIIDSFKSLLVFLPLHDDAAKPKLFGCIISKKVADSGFQTPHNISQNTTQYQIFICHHISLSCETAVCYEGILCILHVKKKLYLHQ